MLDLIGKKVDRKDLIWTALSFIVLKWSKGYFSSYRVCQCGRESALFFFYNTCASAVEEEVVSRQSAGVPVLLYGSAGFNVGLALWQVEKSMGYFCNTLYLQEEFACFSLSWLVGDHFKILISVDVCNPSSLSPLSKDTRAKRPSDSEVSLLLFSLLSEQAVNLWLARAYLVSCHLSPAQRERYHTL